MGSVGRKLRLDCGGEHGILRHRKGWRKNSSGQWQEAGGRLYAEND